jgi:N-acetyl-alpha-D-muramate 1-phosphate uridylyltransferase
MWPCRQAQQVPFRLPSAKRAEPAAAGTALVAAAMILAAGRGERMRPLSDMRPKPLLEAGGKPLIVWQIERLVAAGFNDIVVNVAHLAADIESALGSGARFGAMLRYSREPSPLEVAGGIATALPLLGDGVLLIVSAVWQRSKPAPSRRTCTW